MNILIPPSLSSMAPQLQEFFDWMVHKLNVNSHKDAIRDDDIDGLLSKMAEEIQEFRDQRIKDPDDPNNLEELCDVSNFAFLLYAYLRSRGVKDMKERFIEEYLEVIPKCGAVFCAKTRSGSPLRVGDEVKGTIKNGRCRIRTQHSTTGTVISIARSDLIWWAEFGVWPGATLVHRNGNKLDDRICNLEEPEEHIGRYPFVSQYRPRGREKSTNYGRFVYQRRHAFKLVRVGYWDTPAEAAREGLKAWKKKTKEGTRHV